ncbi:hydrogenase expression protein HypA [Photobacterium nomapromontoriensis]|uniref:hydrogenase expression protein HypA n=1 Tax=Photobacterium nomapromontoriensis TaxID=2910237 RepID=UPI003D0A251C
MRRYLGCYLLAACSLILTACGGGSEEATAIAGPAAPTSTTFTVSVDLPATMRLAHKPSFSLISKAYADAQKNLSEHNFAAVWLDDKGKIFQSIDITRWESLGDGNYVIDAGTKTRINAVLLVDTSGVPEFTLGEPLPEGLYMTPLANERLAITLESSLTYYALAQRIVKNENWGVFTEVFEKAPRGRVLFAWQDINNMAIDIRDTLFPKLGLEGLTLKDLMTLSIVQSMTNGRVERYFTEESAAIADIQAILNDGYWQVGSYEGNNGNGILADSTQFDGSQTQVTEYRWEKSDDADINLNEFFTYLSNSTAFGTDDITVQILTNDGWTGLFSYLKVLLATPKTALLTDAALIKEDEAGITLNANVYSLAGKRMHDFLSSKENHYLTRYLQDDASFTEGASGFYFTWRPENEAYLLCDNTNDKDTCRIYPILTPEAGYTTLDEVITPLIDVGPGIESVNGFKLSNNIVVELIDDGRFTIRFWGNIADDEWVIQDYGVWAPTNVAGKPILRFDVPDIIKQLADDYRFNSLNLFLVEDRGFVNIGESLLDNTEYHYSGFDNDAKEQIFSATTRDNLPPFGDCIFGNTDFANESLFLNAVTECGGDERLSNQSVDDLVDKTLVQITPAGEITAHVLRSDNSWDHFRHTDAEPGSRSWSITDDGYLKLLPDNTNETEFDYWALANRDYAQRLLAFKRYSNTSGGAEISNIMTREYASNTLSACIDNDSGWNQSTTRPVTKKTLSAYQDQTQQCKQIWFGRDPIFTETLLIGQTGNLSDDKALTFANDSSRYLKLSDNFSGEYFLGHYVDSDGCGFNIEIRWKLEDDGTLYYEALDGSMNERIQLTDTDGRKLAIKAFNQQSRWVTDETAPFASDEGEMRSDIVTLIRASEVPNVIPVEPPAPTPPDEGETPPAEEEPAGPPAGTVLNDGQICAFL